MPDISGQDLVMIIQAVDEKIHRLNDQLKDDSVPDGRDAEELLFRYMNVADHLEKAYQEALAMASNLPAYDSLVVPLEDA